DPPPAALHAAVEYGAQSFVARELPEAIGHAARRAATGTPAPAEDELFEFEGWRLDPLKRRLTAPDGAMVSISSVEFRLLLAFLEHPRQVLDRDRLLDLVQGREAHLFDRAVDNQVSRLRRKIEADSRNPTLIQTVWGGGYMLAAEVRRVRIGN
ncbi:MAG: winged helix-turn-helix domain-containing protein, partial [Novosphingobium sp.]